MAGEPSALQSKKVKKEHLIKKLENGSQKF